MAGVSIASRVPGSSSGGSPATTARRRRPRSAAVHGGARPGRRRHPGAETRAPPSSRWPVAARACAAAVVTASEPVMAQVEHVALDGLGVGAAGDPLQHQPEHRVADVGVAGPLARRPPGRGVLEGQRLHGGRRRAFHAADDPGGVGQQMPHADRPERGRQGQPGQVIVDRGVQVESGVVLAQQRHGRHRLADGGHRHERLRRQRPARGGVGDADRELVPPPVRPDQPHRQPGDAAPLAREPSSRPAAAVSDPDPPTGTLPPSRRQHHTRGARPAPSRRVSACSSSPWSW